MAGLRRCHAFAAAALAAFAAACSRAQPEHVAPGARAAPALLDYCDPDAPGIAAHPSHARAAMACLECHAPCTGGQRVAFGPLARTGGVSPRWDPAARTCSDVYCHLAGSRPPAVITWAYLDPSRPRTPEVACSGCHGYPPAPPHESLRTCGVCHPLVVRPDGTIDVPGGRHVDGQVDVSCAGCHGFPPQTGAHVAHVAVGDSATETYGSLATLQDRFPGSAPTEAPAGYAFGCGNCHPISPAHHRDGSVQVELRDAAAPSGTIKARAGLDAAYDPTNGTCSGTYCHSSGQEHPAYVVTPAWTSGASPGCAGCHENPPTYPSGGAGAIDANSHVNLADDGYEFGHFLGLGGPWHGTKHGYEGAAAITCQTCHADTVDPANTGPGGVSYLDTTGRYLLPGGDSGRIASGWALDLDCVTCHSGTPGAPQRGTGRVLPLRHVNGFRDVVFDARTTLPPVPGLPPPPNRPTRPYWVAYGSTWVPWPPSAVREGSTISFSLSGASFYPETKTCSGVTCHLIETPVWGRPFGLGRNEEDCRRCHSF